MAGHAGRASGVGDFRPASSALGPPGLRGRCSALLVLIKEAGKEAGDHLAARFVGLIQHISQREGDERLPERAEGDEEDSRSDPFARLAVFSHYRGSLNLSSP